MFKIKKYYPASFLYLILIVCLNWGFSIAPFYHLWGGDVTPFDMVVGVVYIFRDFCQRELGHYVFVPMILGAILSYFLADKMIAIASILSFMVGETVDWAVFTFTKRPLEKRLLLSAGLSSPVDSAVFMAVISRLHIVTVTLMTCGKWLGVLAIWTMWKHRPQPAY